VTTPLAILTSYEEWRICWLDTEDSNELVASDSITHGAPYQTPTKTQTKEKAGQKLEEGFQALALDPPSPEPPATPSRARDVGSLQKVDHEQKELQVSFEDDEKRILCATDVLAWDNMSLPIVLASVVKKMMTATQGRTPKILRLANETTSAWKKAPDFDSLNFELSISATVRNFYLWEYLGHGADGKTFLVSGGTKGAVGVLKFFHKDAEARANHECKMWKAVYSHLTPVASVRVVRVLGQTALLMPWFQIATRNETTLAAVKATLLSDYNHCHIQHNDVAWRNIGVYEEQGTMKAVVFDMQSVSAITTDGDWVEKAVASLNEKLE
jgi:hypothetical protein